MGLGASRGVRRIWCAFFSPSFYISYAISHTAVSTGHRLLGIGGIMKYQDSPGLLEIARDQYLST